jgi:hypothetical protein
MVGGYRSKYMPRGYSTVMFVGGRLNGESLEMPTNRIASKITNDSERFFAEGQDGGVSVWKGHWSSSKDWLMFLREIYTKSTREDEQIIYTFSDSLEVDRCEAKTQKGTRCMKEALEDIVFCRTHK